MTTENNPAHDMTLTRVFDAPRALVFKAWTDSGHLAQWWGPHGFTNPRCEADPRPGGLIRIDMRAPDGTVYPMPGAYREVVEPERIVFTAGALGPDGTLLFEILSTVTFAESEGKTTVTLRTHVLTAKPGAEKHLEGQKIGWSQSLERLGAYMAEPQGAAIGREIVISRVFDAPRELLWQAMTDPAHVVQWWGPHGFTTTIEEMDVRPGGVWKLTMHGPDGTDFPNKSIFTVVEKPSRICFSHGGGRKGAPGANFEATWTFDELDGGKTRATIRMLFPTVQDLEKVVREYGAIEGGKQTLERLAAQFSDAPFVIERTFDAPADLVWKAITEKDRMKEWFFMIENFAPVPGREFDFTVEHQGMTYPHLCKVTEVIPGKKLAYTWRYEGYEGNSLVTFELTPEGDKTLLRLTHEGLGTFPKLPSFTRGNFVNGWTMLIGMSLMDYLNPKD
ncbi:MAG: SRPBCC domain-containing protein [Chthoniobacteraceae bacterium]|jgi:uncharacterized protein YndB with AHSA1/START domain